MEYSFATTNIKVLELVQKVKSGNFKANEKVYFDNVSDELANKIKNLTGIDVKGFKVAIEARQIDHILKDHGEKGLTDQSLSSDEDIAKMEVALKAPDDLSLSGKTQAYSYMKNGYNKTADTILYEKSIGEKSYYVVQAVPDTKAKTLYIVSAFIGQKGYKKGTSQLINAKSPDATAKSGSVVVPTNNIPNSSENVNSEVDYKEKQLQIILDNNPANTDYATWIRTVDDIHTLQETLETSDWQYDEFDPDYSRQDALDAIKSGKIKVFSSYPISQGVFVTPSRMEAESYAGNGKVYEQVVDIDDVAWIDPTQGQYAKIDADSSESAFSMPETDVEADNMQYSQTVTTENGDIDTAPLQKLDVAVEAERLEKRFGRYKLGRNALETKIQDILDNSNPTNFLRAMRLVELLANDFENVEQVGYANILRHLNYTLVNNQLDYLSRKEQSKWSRRVEIFLNACFVSDKQDITDAIISSRGE